MTRARPLLPLFRRQKRRPPRRPPALRRPSPSAHRRAASLEENTGAGTTGMRVKACSKIEVHDIRVKGVHCDAQNAVGVQYMHIDANEIPRPSPWNKIEECSTGAKSGRSGAYSTGVPRRYNYVEK